MQTSRWRLVKFNWGFEAVVCRGARGEITGSAAVLVRRFPVVGTSLLYAPRGPVCDPHDGETLRALKSGVDLLAARHRAHAFKMDPDLPMSDETFASLAREMGFSRFFGPEGFETIQARFNYRLALQGRTEEELLAHLTQQTRRNIRIAMRQGVQVRIAGPEGLDDFSRLMEITGRRDGFAVRPKTYFARFLSALGDHARLYLAIYQGKTVAGAVATCFGGKTCYVYGASDNEHRNVMPNYLVQWEMIRWALETGCSVYDFQGISGNFESEDNPLFGLYRFKRGFNGQVDELAGEFDYVYRPLSAKLANGAAALNERLRHLRHAPKRP